MTDVAEKKAYKSGGETELVPFQNATKLAVCTGLYQGRSTADLEEGMQPCDPIWQLFPDSSFKSLTCNV
jgi:RecB family endonuclease NucS